MWVQRCRFRFLMTSFTVVDEDLGIYPTVEGRGPTEPFNKSLPSLVTLTKYLLYPVRLIFWHNLLQFGFVEVPRQTFVMPVRQAVNRWLWTVRVDDCKQFSSPVFHVTFLELSLRFADAHAIANSVLRYSHTFVTVKALPNLFLVCRIHLRRCHTNSAVKRVVVRSYKVL